MSADRGAPEGGETQTPPPSHPARTAREGAALRAPSPEPAAPGRRPPLGPPSAPGPPSERGEAPANGSGRSGGMRPCPPLPSASPRPGAPPRAHRPAHGLSSGGGRRSLASRARAEGRPGPTGRRRTAHVQGAAALRFRPVAAAAAAGRERPGRRAVMASSHRATAAGSGRAPRRSGNARGVVGGWGGFGALGGTARPRGGESAAGLAARVGTELPFLFCRP